MAEFVSGCSRLLRLLKFPLKLDAFSSDFPIKRAGGEGRNRTDECSFCRAVPYHLATPPSKNTNIRPARIRSPGHGASESLDQCSVTSFCSFPSPISRTTVSRDIRAHLKVTAPLGVDRVADSPTSTVSVAAPDWIIASG